MVGRALGEVGVNKGADKQEGDSSQRCPADGGLEGESLAAHCLGVHILTRHNASCPVYTTGGGFPECTPSQFQEELAQLKDGVGCGAVLDI